MENLPGPKDHQPLADAQQSNQTVLQKPNFISWHYAVSLPEFIQSKIKQIQETPKTFNIAAILKNFLSPYRRLSIEGKEKKFGVSGIFDKITFNLTSIFVGASVRTVLLIAWILITILLVPINAFLILLWAAIPVFSFPKYLEITKNTLFDEDFKSREAFLKKIVDTDFFRLLYIFFDEKLIETFKQISDFQSSGIKAGQSIAQIFLTLSKTFPLAKNYLDQKNIKAKDFEILINHLAHYQNKPRGAFGTLGKSLSFGYTNNLDKFCVELTAKNLPPPQKQQLLLRIEKVILRPSANNVLLVGEPGVGRHTSLTSLASAIQQELMPNLKDRRVMLLDAVALLGTGENINETKTNFEAILAEAKHAGNVILAIDAVDQVVSAQEGRIDLTDVLSTILTDNTLPIIGITTLDDFNRFVRPNGLIFKLFEKIDVEEPPREETIDILISKALELAKAQNLKIAFEAILEIVDKSEKLIAYRNQPEKSIVLLGDCVNQINSQKQNVITRDTVSEVLKQQTKVPVGEITKDESTKLKDLERILHLRIVGQDEAIVQIAKAMRRARAEIEAGNRPIGSFLFLGPTGVGKTETAKALAETYFGAEDRMVRLDMSEYQGGDSLKRLIGDSQSRTSGNLSSLIAQNPFSLLLVDEFEKADSDVQNLFLQILDEGLMTDALGKKVNFDNVIIIATSNAAAEYIREEIQKGVLGDNLQKVLVEYVLKQKLFSPELINRFDGVVVYRPLTGDQAIAVTKLMLLRLAKELKESKNIILEITDDLAARIAKSGFDAQFGARPIRRLIADKLEDGIAKLIIEGSAKSGTTIPSAALVKFLS